MAELKDSFLREPTILIVTPRRSGGTTEGNLAKQLTARCVVGGYSHFIDGRFRKEIHIVSRCPETDCLSCTFQQIHAGLSGQG